MAPRATSSQMDFDPIIQAQHAKAESVVYPVEQVVKACDAIDWNAFEISAGANKEWLWDALLPPVAFFANFMQVEVHPGWVGKTSRWSSLVANPGSNKDAPIELCSEGVLQLQHKHRKLYLLDEFSIPFLYQAMKHNDHRVLGCYTELNSLLEKSGRKSNGAEVVDPMTRMIRIYDCRRWGYGIKSDGSFTYDNMEEIPKTLFPVSGAIQPEVWYGHVWADPLSGYWQRWAITCTPQRDFDLPADRATITKNDDLRDGVARVLENVHEAAAKAKQHGIGHLTLKLGNDTYEAFRALNARMKDIKKNNASDPVVLASVNKVLRELISTMGLTHALDQAGAEKEDWDTDIPFDVFERASAQVQYHSTVALNGRPPAAMHKSFTALDLSLQDTAESVLLRGMIMKMYGMDMSGTELKRQQILGSQTPEQWRGTYGRRLEELGLITINMRSNGYSIARTGVPDPDTDASAHEALKKTLETHLQLSIEAYANTLAAPPARARVATASPDSSSDVQATIPAKREELLGAMQAAQMHHIKNESLLTSHAMAPPQMAVATMSAVPCGGNLGAIAGNPFASPFAAASSSASGSGMPLQSLAQCPVVTSPFSTGVSHQFSPFQGTSAGSRAGVPSGILTMPAAAPSVGGVQDMSVLVIDEDEDDQADAPSKRPSKRARPQRFC